jgi:hypothetical protein
MIPAAGFYFLFEFSGDPHSSNNVADFLRWSTLAKRCARVFNRPLGGPSERNQTWQATRN